MSEDWFWEGNVQSVLVEHLRDAGWTIEQQADTASRARGIDILATKDGRTLAVEVKGYPSTVYARGQNAGMPKKTNPTNQASKWFSQALAKAITTTDGENGPEIAIAFPDHPRFGSLIQKSEWALQRLRIGVYLISERGRVECLHPHGPSTH